MKERGTVMYKKDISYDRETRDYAMYLDGELVGFARNYHEAEVTLDQLVFDLMSGQFFLPTPTAAEDEDDSGDLTEAMADDDYAEAMAEQAMGTYNGFVPSTCCFCHKPHAAQSCPEMRALLFAPDAPRHTCGDTDDRPCQACRIEYDRPDALIYPPLDCPHGADCPWCARGIAIVDHYLISNEMIAAPPDVDFSPVGP